MVLLPATGLGRALVATVVISTISYLVLNLVSFGGTGWITYVDFPVRFGLWRVCDTSRTGFCNSWSDRNSSFSNQTLNVFPRGKPSFVSAAQGLEITSLILYVFAALFTAIGLLDLAIIPFQFMFLVAAGLLFPCLAFLPAALGVMGSQGRKNHPGAYLDWAWWNGLVGLIMTVICFVALLACILDVFLADKSPFKQRKGGTPLGGQAMKGSPMSLPRGGASPTLLGGRSSPSIFGGPPVNPYGGLPVNPYAGPPISPYANPGSMDSPKTFLSRFSRSTSKRYPGNWLDYHPAPNVTGMAERYVQESLDRNYGQTILQPYQQFLPRF